MRRLADPSTKRPGRLYAIGFSMHFWHCLLNMRQGLCNGTVSVRLSMPSIDHCSSVRRVCCRRYRSIAARPAPSSNGAAAARRIAARRPAARRIAARWSAVKANGVTFTAAVDAEHRLFGLILFWHKGDMIEVFR